MDSWRDDVDGDGDGEEELNDFTFGGKDAILFLIDASPNMHIKKDINSDEGTPFEMSLRCVHTTLRNKIFGSPNDAVGVLFFGTRENAGVRDFDNLSVFLPFEIPESKSILKVEEYLLEHPIKFETDFGSVDKFKLHEALWQSQTLFNNVVGKTSTKKILLFTCNDDPHSDNDGLKKQASKKSGDLAETGIILELLPVGNESFDVDKFYADLLPESTDGDGLVEVAAQKFEDLMSVVKKRVHKKRAIGRLALDLGGGVKLGVSTYSFGQRATRPSKVRLTRDTNEEVKMQRQFVNLSTGAPLLPSDINKYQEYGGKKIKFTMDETKTVMAMDAPVGLKLLAFKNRDQLRLHQFVRSCHFIYPDENSIKGSRNLFAALLMRCITRNVMAICSCKMREASQPSFVALVPHLEKAEGDKEAEPVPKGFLVFYLPFHDDIRNIPDVNFQTTKNNDLEIAKKLVQKLKLKRYDPEAFENPDLQSHYRLIESLALQQDDVEPVTDFTMPPKDKMDKKMGSLSAEFNSTFVDNSDLCSQQTKKPAYYLNGKWGSKPPAAKKAKIDSDENGSFDVAGLVKSKTVDKLKVDDLKQIVKKLGIFVTGKKKAELVEDVYKNYVP